MSPSTHPAFSPLNRLTDPVSRPSIARILIGASTGALPTLEALLAPLRPPCPAIVVVQHMPPHYLQRMAERLEGFLRIPVHLVEAPCTIQPSTLYLAAGGAQHVVCQNDSGCDFLALRPASESDLNVPSIGQLFDSAAHLSDAASTLAILLSGMGRDGAAAMRALRLAGGECWVEDPETARVASLPKAAITCGAAPRILRGTALGTALRQRLGSSGQGAP